MATQICFDVVLGARELPKMPLGEGYSRARLQIPLEGDGTALVRKCDHNVDGPWPELRRVNAAARVVFGYSARHVKRVAGVIARRGLGAFQNVDEPLGHAAWRARLRPRGTHERWIVRVAWRSSFARMNLCERTTSFA